MGEGQHHTSPYIHRAPGSSQGQFTTKSILRILLYIVRTCCRMNYILAVKYFNHWACMTWCYYYATAPFKNFCIQYWFKYSIILYILCCFFFILIQAVAWCPWQNNLLATGGGTADRTIRLWNTTTGICLKDTPTNSQVSLIFLKFRKAVLLLWFHSTYSLTYYLAKWAR